jgi:hypothetical protein
MTTADRISLGALFATVLFGFLTWYTTTTSEADKLLIEVQKDYHEVLQANFDKNISPEAYFTKFWLVQNKQLRLWQARKIPNHEFTTYMNARVREFQCLTPKPKFAYVEENPAHNIDEYKTYLKAWQTVSKNYEGKMLSAVMKEVIKRAYDNSQFSEPDIAELRNKVGKLPF